MSTTSGGRRARDNVVAFVNLGCMERGLQFFDGVAADIFDNMTTVVLSHAPDATVFNVERHAVGRHHRSVRVRTWQSTIDTADRVVARTAEGSRRSRLAITGRATSPTTSGESWQQDHRCHA